MAKHIYDVDRKTDTLKLDYIGLSDHQSQVYSPGNGTTLAPAEVV